MIADSWIRVRVITLACAALAASAGTERLKANSSSGDSALSIFFSASSLPATIPGAPQTLSAFGGNGQVGLGWNAPASNGGATITNYRVFRGTNSSNTLIVTSGGCANLGAVLGCTDTGLANGQSYYYIVSAVNSVGQGAPSNGATATTAGSLLAAPSLSGPASGITGIPTTPVFSWSSVGGATKYWITVATSSGLLPTDPNATSCPSCAISCNTTALSHSAPTCSTGRSATLNASTTYYWRVQGYNDSVAPTQQGNYSTIFSFTTAGTSATIPGAPQTLSASGGNGQVGLWAGMPLRPTVGRQSRTTASSAARTVQTH